MFQNVIFTFHIVLQKLLEKHAEVEQLKQENTRIKNALEKKQAVVKSLFETLGFTAYRKLNSAMINGVIDYERLKEKILSLEKLEYYEGKWFADGVEFSFKGGKDFKVWVTNSFSANEMEWKLPKRVTFKNLESLSLINSSVYIRDYDKLVCDNTIKYLHLENTTVYNEKIIPFDDIFNDEAPNVV
uniref:Uncharacterized protein n=1 Tax=Panagrolaimus sp. PS1159 TaxID=55785 RepID=A0AC35GQC6_9BILA